VHQVTKETAVTVVIQVLPVHLAQQELKVIEVLTEHQVTQAAMELPEQEVLMESQEQTEIVDWLEYLAETAPLDYQDKRESKVRQA
jgi:hypothetical protein